MHADLMQTAFSIPLSRTAMKPWHIAFLRADKAQWLKSIIRPGLIYELDSFIRQKCSSSQNLIVELKMNAFLGERVLRKKEHYKFYNELKVVLRRL